MERLIEKTAEFLTNHLGKSGQSNSELAYRYEHSLRVANIGLELAQLEGADKKLVALACLLHDVGKFDTENNVDHGRVSAQVARPFLQGLELSAKEVDDICHAIAAHVDGESGYPYENTLVAKIVTDADNIDRYGAYRVYQHMEWSGLAQGELSERMDQTKKLIAKLEKFHQRCMATTPDGNIERILQTDSGNKWFRKQLELQISYFKTYLDELQITVLPRVN